MVFLYLRYIFFASLFAQVSLYSVDFVLFTIPKTGTHLLIPILTELTKKEVYWPENYMRAEDPIQRGDNDNLEDPEYIFFSAGRAPWKREIMDRVWNINRKQGTFLHLHPPYSRVMETYLSKKKCINFFVKRDPRDCIVSLLNHYKYINFNDKEVERIPSDDERLLHMIRTQLRTNTVDSMGWLNSPVCCVLDFNKLMGAHGGASTDEAAIQQLRKITKALKVDISDLYLNKLYKRHFGKGWSFFKGKVGTWRDVFTEAHKAAAKEAIGDLLIELGYEKDYNW